MSRVAIIVAGGSGTRMGSELPKQFHLLHGKPVIWYSIRAFTEAYDDIGIIVVLPPRHMDHASALSLDFPAHVVRATEGGDSRFDSVKNGLSLVNENDLVFVHDAVRCLVTPELIRRCGSAAEQYGNAVPCVEATDTMRAIIGEKNEPLAREYVRLVQTPQVFKADELRRAFAQEYQPGFTDEANVVEGLGIPIHLVEGERENIKITTPVDILVASTIIQQKL